MENKQSYFSEIWYAIKSLLTGLRVTLKEYFTPKSTEQYPENRKTTLHVAQRCLLYTSFDGAGDPYYNETFSSVILIEQVKVTTGIHQIETAEKRPSENKIYTLSGQRVFVEKLSDLPRGIYIVNGKKLLVQ